MSRGLGGGVDPLSWLVMRVDVANAIAGGLVKLNRRMNEAAKRASERNSSDRSRFSGNYSPGMTTTHIESVEELMAFMKSNGNRL